MLANPLVGPFVSFSNLFALLTNFCNATLVDLCLYLFVFTS